MLDSIQAHCIDSLKSVMHADSVKIDSLNGIIKSNNAVFDSNIANQISGVDSLVSHIQACQYQIDSINAQGEPMMKHLNYWGCTAVEWCSQKLTSILDCFLQWIKIQTTQDLHLVDKILFCYWLYIVVFIFITFIVLIVLIGIEKISKRHFKAKTSEISTKIKLILWVVFFILILPYYYAKFIVRFFRYFGLFCGNIIERHHELYSKDGRFLLWFSIQIAFFVPFTLWLVSEPFCFRNDTNLGILMEQSGRSNILWSIICQYLDPGNVASSQVGVGSAIAVISALLGIVCLSGLLVSAIVNHISQTRVQWLKGLIDYGNVKKFKHYVVIIGINAQTASIVRRSLKREKIEYVLIQTRRDVERARVELESKLDETDENKIVYYAGDRTSYEDIVKLHLEKAREVYILGDKIDGQNENDHDAYNVSCLEHVSKYFEEHKKERDNYYPKERLRAHVEFDYQSTFTAFKATNQYLKLDRDIEFVPFNIHEVWAKKIFVDNFAIYPAGNKSELKVQRYFSLDKTGQDKNGNFKGITASCEKTVHLIVVGMNQMGTALATQAALLCHFPNFSHNKKLRTKITFIDDNAKMEAEYYMGRYAPLFELSNYQIKFYEKDKENSPYILDHVPFFPVEDKIDGEYDHLICTDENCLMDVEWEFIEGNVSSKALQNYIKKISEDENKIVTIAICFNESQKALASAMYLPKIVYDKCNQVLVYQQSIFDLVNDVAQGDDYWSKYKNLFPFGMSENSYIENPFDNYLAKLDYFAYIDKKNEKRLMECLADPSSEVTSNLLDDVDRVWNQTGIVRKIASIDAADSIPTRLRSMGINSWEQLMKIKINKDTIKNPFIKCSCCFCCLKSDLRKVDIDNSSKVCIIESEHMRWMMQRLVSAYRPLDKEEQSEILGADEERSELIERKKNEERALFDICSFKKQCEIDSDHAQKDAKAIDITPCLIFGRELLSILRLNNYRFEDSQHYHWLKEFFRNGGKFNSFVFIKDSDNKSFWMSDATVTVKQWYDVMGMAVPENDEECLPKVNISKEQIDDFLDILRKRSGLHFELPSFEQWSTAAKSHDRGEKVIKKRFGKGRKSAKRFKLKDAEKLHHILGNVWEWTNSSDDHGGFRFCGGSFRFKEKESSLGTNYCVKSWDAKSKSKDLGFRLIWPFASDIRWIKGGNTDNDNGTNDKKIDENKVVEWFKKHEMVKIEKGFFVMGSDKDLYPETPIEERPRHTVEISNDFYICSVPVTQSLWNAVLRCDMRKNPTENQYGEEFPQTDVSWKEIRGKFLKKLNKLLKNESFKNELLENNDELKKYFEEQKQKKNSLIFRLPTEAEWEYAAKGGNDKNIYGKIKFKGMNYTYSKNDVMGRDDANEVYMNKKINYLLYSGSDKAEDVAWFNQPSIHEVAKKKANKGLYDMSGNVWEWCYDYYIAEMYPACKVGDGKIKIQNRVEKNQYNNKGYIIDPVALDHSYSAHVLRGGSWRCPTEFDCRCTRANFWVEDHKSNDIGFRLVLGPSIEDLGKTEGQNETKTQEQS